jgi:hypothetical protein
MATTTRVIDANVSGTVYTNNLNSALEAIDTCHSGITAPTDEVANGKLWLDTTTTPAILKVYNNATWAVVHSGTVDINAGTIDGTSIGAATRSTGLFTTIGTTGLATLASADINGGNIDGTVIGATTPGAATFSTVAGSGTGLTALSATQLTTGTIPNARISALPTANVSGLDTALAAKVDETVSVTAGNGLSGGGALTATRTITMGTPGAVTATSTDAVTATSHTHSLSAANVGTRIGQLSVGSVGTFAALSYLGNTANRSPGYSQAGSNLDYWAFSRTNASTAPGGTWELQGAIEFGSSDNKAAVWLRVI